MADAANSKRTRTSRRNGSSGSSTSGAPVVVSDIEVIDLTKESPKMTKKRGLSDTPHPSSSTADDSIIVVDDSSEVSIIGSSILMSTSRRKRTRAQQSDASVNAPLVPAAAPLPKRAEPDESVWKCPVCLRTNNELKKASIQIQSPNCGHVLCAECVKQLSDCPVCRKKFPKSKKFKPIFL